eukprot:GEMP01029127.1.p1 GENE.GEMP01029127.1~~GEMP01029127.1.p1  ORF type:complete len:234 (+),score=60.73 GEMP01029127.1:113-814(+)
MGGQMTTCADCHDGGIWIRRMAPGPNDMDHAHNATSSQATATGPDNLKDGNQVESEAANVTDSCATSGTDIRRRALAAMAMPNDVVDEDDPGNGNYEIISNFVERAIAAGIELEVYFDERWCEAELSLESNLRRFALTFKETTMFVELRHFRITDKFSVDDESHPANQFYVTFEFYDTRLRARFDSGEERDVCMLVMSMLTDECKAHAESAPSSESVSLSHPGSNDAGEEQNA